MTGSRRDNEIQKRLIIFKGGDIYYFLGLFLRDNNITLIEGGKK